MKTPVFYLLCGLLACAVIPASAALPVANEEIVVTCFSGSFNYYSPSPSVTPNPLGFVVAQFNTTSGTIGSLIPPTANPPVVWTGVASAGYHNEFNTAPTWTRSRLGEVFGITLDDSSPPNIYVGASDVYNMLGATGSLNDLTAGVAMGPGGIYRLDATSGAITPNALPAQAGGPGIGNLCFHRATGGTPYLFVSNLEDGKIYRVDPTTLTVSGAPFDHGVAGRTAASLTPIADNGAPGLTQYGRRVWGVKTYQNRLFYAVWWDDARFPNATQSNEIWSVDLDAAGNFLPATAQLRITLPPSPGDNWSYPVASIDFAPSGAMFLAERYWHFKPLSGTPNSDFGPHFCRVLRYSLSGPNWVTTPSSTHLVGADAGSYFSPPSLSVNGSNSAGGVAVNCDESIWATGDMFNGYLPVDSTTNLPMGSPYLYGAMRIQAGGNVGPPSGHGGFIVDYDGAYTVSKVAIGGIVTRRQCCALFAPSPVVCPTTPGGAYTLSLGITNPTSTAITSLQFTAVTGPLPPGAITVAPSPSTAAVSIPPAGTGSVALTLPNVPPIGGSVCFIASVLDTRGDIICSQTICVTAPKCPCAVVTATPHCPACLGLPHTLDLTIQNIWTIPYYNYSFVPLTPGELLPGETAVVPAGAPPLGTLLPNTSVTLTGLTVPGIPLTGGGPYCFKVRFYDFENHLVCEEKVCFNVGLCNPPSGMALTQVGGVICPTYPGGPFSLTFTITNNQATAATGATLGACAPGSNFGLGPNQSTLTFNPALGVGQSVTQTVSINGLQLGQTGCLCVQFLSGQSPLCMGQLCFTLPATCPTPACMVLSAQNIRCPVAPAGYLFDLNLTNNSGTAASYYQLTPVQSVNLPLGSVTAQPAPGTGAFSGSVGGSGGTALITNIQLPATVPEGVNFCFLVTIRDVSEAVICTQMVCLPLPRCSCATVTANVTCLSPNVPPFGPRQLVFTVTNNTNVVGTPFSFSQASVIPAVGFSPSAMVPSPNPIPPGGTGTFTTTYTLGNEPQCIMLLFANANGTRCCRVRFCPPWVYCGPPRDRVDIGGHVVTDLDGYAASTAWITNTSATQSKRYAWTLTPADMPDCDGTLPANAFAAASGTTGIVLPGSSQGVSFSVNGESLTPGVCAGFQICFSEISPFFSEPVCGQSVLRRSRAGDPLLMSNPTNRAIPVLAGDFDSVILNPWSEPLDFDIVVFDTGGQTAFTNHGPPWASEANEVLQHISVEEGGVAPLLLEANIAVGTPPVAVAPALSQVIWIRPCTSNPRGYDILGTQIHFRPGGAQPFTFPPPGPRVLPVSELMFSSSPEFPVIHFTMASEPGAEYHAFADTDLIRLGTTGGTRIWPYPGLHMIYSAGGTFLGKDGVMVLDLPGTAGAGREFFKVGTAKPDFSPP